MSRKKVQQSTKNQVIRENEKLRQDITMLRQENEELKKRLAEKKPENFKKPKKLDEQDIERAKEMRKEGQSYNKIGQAFGVTEGTIRNYLKNVSENESQHDIAEFLE